MYHVCYGILMEMVGNGVKFVVSTLLSTYNMKIVLLKLAVALVPVFFCVLPSGAQESGYDVFKPIAKYMARGDVESLSAWFAHNMEISVFSKSNDASRSQAIQIIKSFFKSHTPRSFEITHKAGRANMKYALGTMNAGGELFLVTIFVSLRGNAYKIQQLKIERLN